MDVRRPSFVVRHDPHVVLFKKNQMPKSCKMKIKVTVEGNVIEPFFLFDLYRFLPRFACTEPESFFRVGPTMTFLFCCFVDEGTKYHEKRAIIGPPAKRHLNDVLLACQ